MVMAYANNHDVTWVAKITMLVLGHYAPAIYFSDKGLYRTQQGNPVYKVSFWGMKKQKGEIQGRKNDSGHFSQLGKNAPLNRIAARMIWKRYKNL